MKKSIAIVELYHGDAGRIGYYNNQEIGLAKAYAKEGYKVTIHYPDTDSREINTSIINDNITIFKHPAKALFKHSYYDPSFLLDEDIEFAHIGADNQLAAPMLGSYLKRHGIKYYNYVGTLSSSSDNSMKKLFMNALNSRNIRAYRRSVTFAKTARTCEELKLKGVDAKLAPVGLDLDLIPRLDEGGAELKGKLGLPKDKKIAIFVGRLEDYKRPLNAVKLINMLDDPWHLLMIGDGYLYGEVENIIESNGLKDRITRISSVPNEDIHAYYKAADCYVNFNEQEIFGMGILEAMYQGCPVVAMHAPGPDDIVVDGETGYLCDDLSGMALAVNKVTPGMGDPANKRVTDHFSWESTAGIILGVMA